MEVKEILLSDKEVLFKVVDRLTELNNKWWELKPTKLTDYIGVIDAKSLLAAVISGSVDNINDYVAQDACESLYSVTIEDIYNSIVDEIDELVEDVLNCEYLGEFEFCPRLQELIIEY